MMIANSKIILKIRNRNPTVDPACINHSATFQLITQSNQGPNWSI